MAGTPRLPCYKSCKLRAPRGTQFTRERVYAQDFALHRANWERSREDLVARCSEAVRPPPLLRKTTHDQMCSPNLADVNEIAPHSSEIVPHLVDESACLGGLGMISAGLSIEVAQIVPDSVGTCQSWDGTWPNLADRAGNTTCGADPDENRCSLP